MKRAIRERSGRGRIGLMIPSVNSVLESEFSELRLEGITFHFNRMPISKGDPVERLNAMRRFVPTCLEGLRDVADIVAFACTSGSFVIGPESERLLREEMGNALQKPVITTTQASIEALKDLNARNVGVLTPYSDEVNEKLQAYMEACGFRVSVRRIDVSAFGNAGCYPEELLYEAAREFARAGRMDALFISCTNLATWQILQYLEDDLGRPVVTANQATLWLLLKAMKYRDQISGLGMLLKQC